MSKYNKIETESGYPCYIDNTNNQHYYDHPHFRIILKSLEKYNEIKYSAYRTAFKIYELQKHLKVPPLRITSGVFARHQLSLSESSLSLDPTELEAVLADIYFAAEKEGAFSGDIDLTVDLMINLLLNVYDEHRTTPIRVLAVKSLLILLSEETVLEKWQSLANCCADHNGCVSPRRLAALLTYINALPRYLGINCDQIQTDVDACFDKSAGMLGISSRAVAEWGVQNSASARWLPVLQRILIRRGASVSAGSCSACNQLLAQVLHFKCSKCRSVYFCENCYLYDKNITLVSGHKRTHLVHEIIDDEVNSPECLSFVSGMKRFFCTSTRKKKTSKKEAKKQSDKQKQSDKTVSVRRKGKPSIFTSTVGKASGNNNTDPTSTLQDIINQLEGRNIALKELLQNTKNPEDDLKEKVDSHYSMISAQIDRLKALKENLTQADIQEGKTDKAGRPQAFDLFSPIPVVDEKQSRIPENAQPRVLSMDSGNFSVVSKGDAPRMTMSGDELKPVLVHATSDSISAVSVGDVSNWYNGKYIELFYVYCWFYLWNSGLLSVLDRLQQILTNNFATDDSCFDNTQLRETANEMEGLLGTLIRGVEQRATLNATKGLV
ncbi:PREDICTED: dystrophin, isoform E-like [Papilio polytes]|uniref:dystrophin, isoform E-like n=1 Tax=Papilio polytes TaxID=76194 RepID=UPI0006762384|nr:PREDICTED: dystrophin, isoform E-like [Papilio polytes]